MSTAIAPDTRAADIRGGGYTAVQNPDGTWNILDVPILCPIKKGVKGAPQDVGQEWMGNALGAAKLRAEEQHYGALHVYHNDDFTRDPEQIGFILPTRVGATKYEGEWVPATFADFLCIHPEEYQKIKERRRPYRSPELHWDTGEIASVALLTSQTPFFRLPMLFIATEIPYEGPIASEPPASFDSKETRRARAAARLVRTTRTRFQAADMGMEEKRRLIDGALNTHLGIAEDEPRVWVHDLFDDYAVYSEPSSGVLVKVPFTISEAGDVSFGASARVRAVYQTIEGEGEAMDGNDDKAKDTQGKKANMQQDEGTPAWVPALAESIVQGVVQALGGVQSEDENTVAEPSSMSAGDDATEVARLNGRIDALEHRENNRDEREKVAKLAGRTIAKLESEGYALTDTVRDRIHHYAAESEKSLDAYADTIREWYPKDSAPGLGGLEGVVTENDPPELAKFADTPARLEAARKFNAQFDAAVRMGIISKDRSREEFIRNQFRSEREVA